MQNANFAPMTIWTGDNLEIMRGMNSDSVDLIYLDPPFNSNRNYGDPIGDAKFKDTWTLDDVNIEEHGELADRSQAAYRVIEAAKEVEGKSTQAYLVFMAVRLLEMERILKPTGQIFLHCDDFASAWLTNLMKAIFGKAAYQNAIAWRRSPGMNSGKNKVFQRNADHILHFAGPEAKLSPHYVPFTDETLPVSYKYDDGDGRLYARDNLRAPTHNEPLKFKWKGYDHPAKGWCGNRAFMQDLHDRGLLYYPVNRDGSPAYEKRVRLKRYADESNGHHTGNVWTDINMLNAKQKESTGYPTQKPLALLERIIEAGSKKGDVVFDPFCGCATTLVAADRLQRNWIGIDLCEVAVDLVKARLQADGALFKKVKNPARPPRRSDVEELPDYRTHKHSLYGEQEGYCNGCHCQFPFTGLTVDHKDPRSQGGSDAKDNLQLLCTGCNSSKGDKTMAEWRAWKKKNHTGRWEAEQERKKARKSGA